MSWEILHGDCIDLMKEMPARVARELGRKVL